MARKSSSKSSSKSRAAARGAARAAATAAKGGASSLNAAGRAALARSKAVPAKTTVPATPADIRRYAKEEAQAQADLTEAGYSPEFINQVSTFWQEIAKLPQEQQESIMTQLQQQANSTVDGAFDSEQSYLNTLKAAKQKSYDDQFALFEKGEKAALEQNAAEANRGTAAQLQSAYAGLAGNNAFDTGVMRSIADRAVEGRERVLSEDRAASELALAGARQQRDSAGNLLSIQAEQDLLDVANRRAAARSQRLSQLIGLNASQSLLAQVPSANQLSLPTPSPSTNRTRANPITPLKLPSVTTSGYRDTTYLSPSRQRAAARGAARASKNSLISNF